MSTLVSGATQNFARQHLSQHFRLAIHPSSCRALLISSHTIEHTCKKKKHTPTRPTSNHLDSETHASKKEAHSNVAHRKHPTLSMSSLLILVLQNSQRRAHCVASTAPHGHILSPLLHILNTILVYTSTAFPSSTVSRPCLPLAHRNSSRRREALVLDSTVSLGAERSNPTDHDDEDGYCQRSHFRQGHLTKKHGGERQRSSTVPFSDCWRGLLYSLPSLQGLACFRERRTN